MATRPVWAITSVTDATIFDAQRGPQAAKRVEFQLLDGTRSQITVSEGQFNAAEVSKQVDEAARKLYEVLALKGAEVSDETVGS